LWSQVEHSPTGVDLMREYPRFTLIVIVLGLIGLVIGKTWAEIKWRRKP